MALSAKVVSFLLSDGIVGTTQAITGVGFQPKAIIFWQGGSPSATSTTDDTNSGRAGFGFATGATQRGCVCYWVNDNEATMETACAIRTDQVMATVDGTDLTTGRWDLQSLDGDGFTIIVDQDASSADANRVHALCLGGSDITNALASSFTKAAATGNQAVTGVGFKPDIVFFLTTGEGGPAPDSDSTARFSFGVARTSSEQFVLHGFSEDGTANSNTERYARTDECVMGRINGSFANQRGSLVSLDSDGFTINWIEGTNAIPVIYLALKGGSYKIGNSTTATSLTTIPTTGYGFAPKAVMVASHLNSTQSTAGTLQSNLNWSLGAADSPTSRGSHGGNEQTALGTSNYWLGINYAAIYLNLAGGAGLVGLMDVDTFDSDGITFIMDDADPTEGRVFGYIGFGDTPAAITGTLSVTLGAATLSATARAEVQGTLSTTLGAATLSAAAQAEVQGTLSTTLGAATLSATALAEVQGTLSTTLGAATLSAAAQAEVQGALSTTLDAATLSATAQAEVSGSLSATLEEATLMATAQAEIQGMLNVTLDSVILTANGIVTPLSPGSNHPGLGLSMAIAMKIG